MILINLLPHREERRRQRKRAFFTGLGLSALGGLLVAGLWYAGLQQMVQAQNERNTFLRDEIAKLEAQIKDIATLRAEIDSLKARQGAVEDLQLNRNVPVHLLDELVRLTPEGIVLQAIKQTEGSVQVNGMAQSNERVSEFLRSAQNNSPWFERMDLVEIKAVTLPAAPGTRETRRLFEFALKISLKLPGAAASAPAGGASAAKPAPAKAA